MNKVLTKSKLGSMFIIYVDPNDDRMNHNDIKTMMWDIADAMDRKHKGCIQIPSKYSSAFRNVYNDRDDYPFFYYHTGHIYGICVDNGKFNVSDIKELFKEYKIAHHINCTMFMSYNYFDTFWIPAKSGVVGFAQALEDAKTKYIDERILTFIL